MSDAWTSDYASISRPASGWFGRFCEEQVRSALEKMRLGRLRVELPDLSTRARLDDGAVVSAPKGKAG